MAKINDEVQVLDDGCYELKNAEYTILREAYGYKEAKRLMGLDTTSLDQEVLDFLEEIDE